MVAAGLHWNVKAMQWPITYTRKPCSSWTIIKSRLCAIRQIWDDSDDAPWHYQQLRIQPVWQESLIPHPMTSSDWDVIKRYLVFSISSQNWKTYRWRNWHQAWAWIEVSTPVANTMNSDLQVGIHVQLDVITWPATCTCQICSSKLVINKHVRIIGSCIKHLVMHLIQVFRIF